MPSCPNSTSTHTCLNSGYSRIVDVECSSGNIQGKVLFELRHNSPYWWARATPYFDPGEGTYGGGTSLVGTVKVRKRKRLVGSGDEGWEPWVTMKSRSVYMADGQQWTDDNYNPVNSDSTYDRQIRAAFTTAGDTCSTSGTWSTPEIDI